MVKAKCIMNVKVESFLELGKIYDVKESPIDHQYYLVKDETGCVNAFDYYRFELIK